MEAEMREVYLSEAFWEEIGDGVPLTPEQKADLEKQRRILHRIDSDDE